VHARSGYYASSGAKASGNWTVKG